MFSVVRCGGILLLTWSFLASAADAESYVKCASIEKPAERVKCYDALTKRPSSTSKPSSMTKSDARGKMMETIASDADYRADPLKKVVMTCGMDLVLDETFGTSTELNSAAFERRMTAAMERIKNGIENKDPDVTLAMLKCTINSGALQQVSKSKSEQGRPPSATAPTIDLDDLRTDISTLKGRKVRIQGLGQYMMNIFMIQKTSSDMNPILIDITKLHRDQHRKLLQQCSDIMSRCAITVLGVVRSVNSQTTILAEGIEW